jgi:hypothetical protein
MWGLMLALAMAPQSLDEALQAGWGALQADRPEEAARWYASATELAPESEDAWLGLQRAQIAARRWSAAMSAGDQALRLDPHSWWACSRQAYAAYMAGDYGRARDLYETALIEEPGDAQMMLGLSFSLARLGDPDGARRWCDSAAAAGADARACRADGDVRVAASASTTFLTFGGGALSDLKAFTVSAGATWPSGLGVWAGLTRSVTSLGLADDFEQTVVAGGLRLQRAGWTAGVAGGRVMASVDQVDGAGVVLGRLGYDGGVAGLGVSSAATFYSDATVVQIDPAFTWRPWHTLTLSAGPSLSIVRGDPYTPDGAGSVLVSAQVSVAWTPVPALTLSASAFRGPRRYRVEAEGLSVWTGSERYTSGMSAGLRWAPADTLGIFAEVERSSADEEAGHAVSFDQLGGTVGLDIVF